MIEKSVSFDCKIDIRGLLVRDVNFDELGGKIDGVYELSKKQVYNMDLEHEIEDEGVQFLKAKVILKPARISITEFSRMSDKTKLEVRQLNLHS